MSEIQCVVVTPEKTEIDVMATAVTVPMFDGEKGILAGHSPLVGRLGYGVLKITQSGKQDAYFIEGGFVQVAANVVSVLTDGLSPLSEVTQSVAEKAWEAALEIPSDDPELTATRQKAKERAWAMKRAAI